MKITNNFNINTYSFQAKKKNPPEIVNAQTPIEQEVSPYPVESLKEIYNVKPKKMNVDEAKSKLLRQLNEVLHANRDIDELYNDYVRQFTIREQDFLKRIAKLYAERDELVENLPSDIKELEVKFKDIESRRAQLEKDMRKKYEFVLPEKRDAEKLEILEAMKLEQQKANELNELRSNFDDTINKLYMNDMSGLASTCSKYRPENLDEKSIEKADFIIDVINNNCSEDLEITAKDKVKSIIVNRDAYYYYKENDSANPIYKKAIDYAKDYDGNVDIDKVGEYLHNAEIIQNAPESLEYVADKEIIEGIINRAKTLDEQVKYLCRFNEYSRLSDKQKTEINKILDIFYLDDSIEKYMLKQIVETKYVKENTVAQARINDSGDTVQTTITANAKQQILNKYKFPNCLVYMQAFEDGMKMIASDWGSTGIKKTGTNNKALEYKLEIKIMGHDDRLFSRDNDYYFDVFSDRGLH